MKMAVLAFLSLGLVDAAPRLLLSTTTVGPLNVAPGSTGPTQSIGIQNTGDGALHLTAATNTSWLSPTVTSNSLEIALQTASLAKGIYTGSITLKDPNAVDAPQTVTVTVQIGGGVPDQLNFVIP